MIDKDKMQIVEKSVRLLKKEMDKLYNLVVKESVIDERDMLTCKRCSWKWKTESKARKLSCPSCGIKVDNVYAENAKNDKKVIKQDGAYYYKGHTPTDILKED